MQSQQPKKILTNSGKPIARYTLVCFWKEEYHTVDIGTGKLRLKWTYRCDDEIEKAKKRGIHYVNPLQALQVLYKKYKLRCLAMQLWDNSLPQEQALIMDAGLNSKGQWEIFSSQKYEQVKNDELGTSITDALQQRLGRPPTIQEFLTEMSIKLKQA